MKGKLFLIPTLLADETIEAVLPPSIRDVLGKIEYFLCENVRTGRRFVAMMKAHPSVEALRFETLNKDTQPEDMEELLEPLRNGKPVGLLSDSGCPAIADPGALAVRYAHRHEIQVVPLTGPSSIVLALMASGLNGQQFAFHGYLPIEKKAAFTAIQNLEKESRARNQTQIFIETPFRNKQLLSRFIETLRTDTILCVAIDVTSPNERIVCKEIGQWKKTVIDIEKSPATFLFQANASLL